MPKSADPPRVRMTTCVHRILAELAEASCVRRHGPWVEYTFDRFVSWGPRHLSNIGAVDLAAPLRAELAAEARGPVHFTWSALHYPMGVGVEVHVLAAKKPHEC